MSHEILYYKEKQAQKVPQPASPPKRVYLIVILPTRESTIQVFEEVKSLIAHTQLRAALCYGGRSYAEEAAQFKDGCEILIATPGRLWDILSSPGRDCPNITEPKNFVIDDVKMGLTEPESTIILSKASLDHPSGIHQTTMAIIQTSNLLEKGEQVTLVGATIPPMLRTYAKQCIFPTTPGFDRGGLRGGQSVATTVTHRFFCVTGNGRNGLPVIFFSLRSFIPIIFCNS